ncbi:mannan endo-1,4-beta-mannosidase [Actinopolymorpha cephalotaxi]|uniref:mannan endo-1,4-beta-mannosidase n=1 Tax=Actinopolymorpha cephalotaxi TaxID=504797 RepID=A0A1I3C843_9ACTN|nr:cellulase family glycosylhydrolase [Actinopolymorpha cephalotaxi]NYH86833.1 mannan endo-1,4-beta-mannosidase [Actinopolymorpha cephalotaxi]SFH70339.1 mannan endo-1,4-beta-mannosidase [Actinopolymorpha cephalotaxi]
MKASAAVPAAALLGSASPARAARQSPFVGTDGTRFTHNGRPFAVAGFNNHYLGWGTRAEVDDVLETAKRSGASVVRTILHSVIGSPDGSVPSTWNWQSTADASNMGMHGTYLMSWDAGRGTWAFNDSAVNGLGRWDYVIWKAERLGLKLDIALIDFWQWAGGVQQVCRWFLPDYNSRAYKDEPAVFAWDLMNEPEADNTRLTPDGTPLSEDWISRMSAYVKSIDANHLVCVGGEGFYDRSSFVDPGRELAIPTIDFGTWHTYPDYHGLTPAQVVELIHRHGETARQAGKPIVLQEFSYSSLHEDQPEALRSWVEAIAADSSCAGWLYWRLVGRVTPAPTRAFPEAENDPPTVFAPDNGEHFDVAANPDATPANVWRSYQVLAGAARQLTRPNQPQAPARR